MLGVPEAFTRLHPAPARFLELAGQRLTEWLTLQQLQASVRHLEQSRQLQQALFAMADLASSDQDMDSMLRGVTIYGTAARASATLKRHDLAGKTGTTNEQVDAWFCGYQRTVVACSWIGFDQPKSLGGRETGGSAALPTWIRRQRLFH